MKIGPKKKFTAEYFSQNVLYWDLVYNDKNKTIGSLSSEMRIRKKIIERIIDHRLNNFIENNRLNLSGQAGFLDNGTTKISQTVVKAHILYPGT